MARRYHLHIPGLGYFALVLLVGLTAMNSQNNLLFWVFGVMASGLVVSGVVSGVMMISMRCKRLDPRHGQVGQPLIARYAITNRSGFMPIFNVHIEELPAVDRKGWQQFMAPARAWVMHIGPGETVHGEAIFWPTARGEAHFEKVRIWTTFPFGIIKKSVTVSQPQHTLIHPRLYELQRRVLTAVAPEGLLGTRTSQRTGAGDDYFGMREYRPGDSMRNIAWKRTAAVDELVCVERSRPSPPKLRVILNLTRAAEDAAGRAREEQAISLAASVLTTADLAGFEIGLAVPGLPIESVPLRASHWHLQKILAALAGLDLDAGRTGPGRPVPDGERAAVVVIHPGRADPGLGGRSAWHLSAEQLAGFAVRSIGWQPAGPDAIRPEPELVA